MEITQVERVVNRAEMRLKGTRRIPVTDRVLGIVVMVSKDTVSDHSGRFHAVLVAGNQVHCTVYYVP